jgi:hypothetical protein
LSALKFEPHLHWLAPRLRQLKDLESFLCQWDEEFRFKFYTGESGEEDKVTTI